MRTIRLANLDEMKIYAARLAHALPPGTVLGLIGDLGTGKTTFTQFFAEALGVTQSVKSPTFVLLKDYTTTERATRCDVHRLWHADAYRIEQERDFWTAGLAEAIEDDSGITIVEWADNMPSLRLLPNYKELTITYGEGAERVITEDPALEE